MTRTSVRIALCLSLLWCVAGCSGSDDESLNTHNIGRADAASIVGEDDAGDEDSGENGGEGEDGGEGLDGSQGDEDGAVLDAGDFDAIVSVEVADAGPAVDTAVVTETPLCGNGTIDGEEQCDQGADNSDTKPGACRSNCRRARCGDGVIDDGEACDQGASNSDSEANACRSDCRAHRCGDAVVDEGEQCDTGDARSDTAAGACRLTCRSARCGDGVRDTDEGCDDGNTVDTDACRNNCRSARCGDGVVDPDEECDDGNTINTDACRDTCRRPICGDRVVDPGEQCDDGNQVNNDGCRSNCRTGCVNDAGCSDNLFCTGVERCVDGLCNPGVGINPDDNIGCTTDVCREDLDRVVHTPNDALCTPPAPTCSGARGTTSTATCDAARGCVVRSTSTACADELSACELRGDGSFTLATYAPACGDSMSCGDATRSTRVCAHVPASCSAARVFTGRGDATCDPNAESCGNRTGMTDDCKRLDSSSCATDGSSHTRVTGACTAANGCRAGTPVITTCNDPPDSCSNAHRRTYAPTCTAATGCGTERVVVDADCSARAATCGPAGGNQAPAVQRYTAACDSNNPGQCVNGGTAAAPEFCQARGAVCTEPAGAVASVATYVPACAGDACVQGGVAQGSPTPCGASAPTCGPNPNGPRGALQQITYTPACQTGASCLAGGRANPQDCTAAPGACSVDGNRAVYTTYQAACNQAGTACVQGGNATRSYCDEVATYCQNGAPVDTVNKCGTNGCEQQVGAVCPTDQRWVCSNSTTRRLQQGGCTFGNGCGYTDTATAQTCVAPRCVPPIEGNIFSSCGGCAVNSDGVATCRSDTTCTTCTNGCNQTTGQCNIRIIVPSPLGGVGTLGGVVSPGTAVVAPGAGLSLSN